MAKIDRFDSDIFRKDIRKYLADTGKSPTTFSRQITGCGKTIPRILKGAGFNSSTLDKFYDLAAPLPEKPNYDSKFQSDSST